MLLPGLIDLLIAPSTTCSGDLGYAEGCVAGILHAKDKIVFTEAPAMEVSERLRGKGEA